MIANLAGGQRPVHIQSLDLLVIDYILSGKLRVNSFASFLQDNHFSLFAQRTTDEQLEKRIEQLEFICNNLTPLTIDGLLPLNDLETAESSESQGLNDSLCYLSMHHCISLTERGLIAFSPVLDTYIQLTGWQSILMMRFAQGGKIQHVIDEYAVSDTDRHLLSNALIKLQSTGLLVEKTVFEAQESKPLNSFQAADVTDFERWEDIEVDGRIPVYFVPHMENHFPLALGVLFNALEVHNEGQLLDAFVLIPISFLSPSDLINGPYRKFGPGVWLFSNYMWSIELNMQISNAIKQHNASNFTIHGGPSTPDYPQACDEFFQEHASVDIAVHGEGEMTIVEIFETLFRDKNNSITHDPFRLSKVPGMTYRDLISKKSVRTEDRKRLRSPGDVPSPYLSGTFDNYRGRVEASIIETNRGCPYGCTFCDWGSATNQKIRKFDLDRTFDEISWIGKNKIKVLWIADANYGLFERDIDISKHIVDTKQKYGYPQEVVVNYTKNSNRRLVEIIKVFSAGGIISQGIISIQTTDEKTLDVINRKNIKTERYDELSQIFSEQQLPLSTDLMIGLPGITVDAFIQDLQRYIDLDVSVKAYPTQLLPNSPMADPEYIKKYQIEVDANNFLISSYSYTQEDLTWMNALFRAHTVADGYGLLRYVIRFLQWEHDIKAMAFLEGLMRDIDADPAAYPLITWALRFFDTDKCIPGGWYAFYNELTVYLCQNYQIEQDSALDVVMAVNRLSMPDDGLSYPHTITLEHDFSAYFACAKQDFRPLKTFKAAKFEVSDPNMLRSIDLNATQYDTHQYFWELESNISRPKSIAKFVQKQDAD